MSAPPMQDPDEARMPSEAERLRQAVEQARKEEQVNARLTNHDHDIQELRHNQIETSRSVGSIRTDVAEIKQTLRSQTEAQEAVARAAEEATSRAVSTRTFLLGVAAVITPLVATLIVILAGHPL